MDVFHVFKILQMVANFAKHHIYLFLSLVKIAPLKEPILSKVPGKDSKDR